MRQNYEALESLILSNGYEIIKKLGDGAFADVYQAKYKGQDFALKCINKKAFIERQRDPQMRQFKLNLLESQVENMKKCKGNINVLQCYGILENKNYKILVLEYCNKGTLSDLIEQRGSLYQIQAVEIISQLLYGFAKLQQNHIIHRDLKTQNILIHNSTYKIADLGMSKEVESLTTTRQGTVVGTRYTMAPQLLNHGSYDIQADMWSLGVIYYELLTGQLPFEGNITEDSIRKIQIKITKMNVSPESKNFLCSLFVIDPTKRLKWAELHRMCRLKQEIFRILEKPKQKPQQKPLPHSSNIPKMDYQKEEDLFKSQGVKYIDQQTVTDPSDSLSRLNLPNQKLNQDQQIVKLNTFKANIIYKKAIEPISELKWTPQNKQIKSNILTLLHLLNKIILEQSEEYYDNGKGSKPGSLSRVQSVNNNFTNYNTFMHKICNQLSVEQSKHQSNQQLIMKYIQLKHDNLSELIQYLLHIFSKIPQNIVKFDSVSQFMKELQTVVGSKNIKNLKKYRQY